jgi:hypothetical protein
VLCLVMLVIADITCNDSAYYLVVSSNPAHGEVYSIQHYIIKFVSELHQVGGFLRILCFFFTSKTDRRKLSI